MGTEQHSSPGFRVVLDCRMVDHSGIGTYIRGLAEGFASLAAAGKDIPGFVFVGPEESLRHYPWFAQLGEIRHLQAKPYSMRGLLAFPRVVADGNTVTHFPHYNMPLVRPSGAVVVTIHDLIHLRVPEVLNSAVKQAVARAVMARAARRADAILTVSNHTRQDILREFGPLEAPITVTPNAVSTSLALPVADSAGRLRRELRLPSKYFLCVGLDKPHKNVAFLLGAFGEWAVQRPPGSEPVGLVVVGGRKDSLLAAEAARLPSEARRLVVLVPYRPPEDLPALYAGATALVFPSKYEGFGLPLIEAQRLGVPVIASNATAVPETVGDGALLFDPDDAGGLMRAMSVIADNPAERDRLASAGRRNEARFSWLATAEATLKVYSSIIPRQPGVR